MSESIPRTVDAIYADYAKRRMGLLKALTEDVDEFFQRADPQRENLCLYGESDGTWSVDFPADEVPPELPEPCLGINFARDGMPRKDWLALVAVHSDSWLLSVAFFYGVKLDQAGRQQLFRLINQSPTLFEIVTGRAGKATAASAYGKSARRPNHMSMGPEQQPSGRIITSADIGPGLKGQQGQLWWPDDAMWYPVEILGVNMKTHAARILYSTGEEEELDLDEMVRERHMTLLVD